MRAICALLVLTVLSCSLSDGTPTTQRTGGNTAGGNTAGGNGSTDDDCLAPVAVPPVITVTDAETGEPICDAEVIAPCSQALAPTTLIAFGPGGNEVDAAVEGCHYGSGLERVSECDQFEILISKPGYQPVSVYSVEVRYAQECPGPVPDAQRFDVALEATPPPNVQRIFNSDALPGVNSPIECNSSADCSGNRCLRITDELSVCDMPAPEASECTPEFIVLPPDAETAFPDECGCDGLTCAANQFCRTMEQFCSCASEHWNVCTEKPCESPTDCPTGTICLPAQYVWDSRCITPQCTSDSDCTAEPNGVCALHIQEPAQGGITSVRSIECHYPP